MMSHKKIHRFFVANLPPVGVGDTLAIGDERIIHQMHAVLRLQSGETVAVFSDGGDTLVGEITALDKRLLTLSIKAIEPAPTVPRTVIAAVSIVKGDAFERMVQKLTEIGVATIVPLVSGRTIKQQVRIDRLQAISDEALEQCGGTTRVRIIEPMSLAECLKQFPFQSVVLDPLAQATGLEHYDETIVCYVGPEGGWNEQDEHIINDAQCLHVQVTNRVLRTDTAAIIGIYNLLWH